MEEIVRVAHEDNLIIICSIHQPSTKIFSLFDQIMILSNGREAFTGDHHEAEAYFSRIGYPMPEHMNPAEHSLDLVNADFSLPETVNKILKSWKDSKQKRPALLLDADGCNGSIEWQQEEDLTSTKGAKEIRIMFRRPFVLVVRDPVLYVGRCVAFLLMNTLFAVVYWDGRYVRQDSVMNKFWVMLWFTLVPALCKLYCDLCCRVKAS
jgi:ABC-2 type transporter